MLPTRWHERAIFTDSFQMPLFGNFQLKCPSNRNKFFPVMRIKPFLPIMLRTNLSRLCLRKILSLFLNSIKIFLKHSSNRKTHVLKPKIYFHVLSLKRYNTLKYTTRAVAFGNYYFYFWWSFSVKIKTNVRFTQSLFYNIFWMESRLCGGGLMGHALVCLFAEHVGKWSYPRTNYLWWKIISF